MLFSLIHPSYGRPQMAYQAYIEWASKAKGEFEYILSLDSRDSTIDRYRQLFKGQNIIVSDSANCVQATNVAAKAARGKVLIYVSDDFGCPHNWDALLANALPQGQSKFCLWVNDTIQNRNAVITIPIISRALYSELGYFWHPAYESMWVDVDLYYQIKHMGCLIDCKQLVFPHRHYSVGQSGYDATYRQHDNRDRQQRGRQIFNQRSTQQGWGKRH